MSLYFIWGQAQQSAIAKGVRQDEVRHEVE